MIVFYNVKITDIKMTWPYAGTVYDRAAWFPVSNRFDIFKYCLASRAVMAPLVDKYIFYIDLAEFGPRQQELQAYMETIFPVDKLEVHWHRIERTRTWREVTAQFTSDNQLIWYEGNDDHIFIDYDLDMINAAQDVIRADPDPNAVMYYSHWPEQMRMSLKLNGELTSDGNFIKYQFDTVDSLLLMKSGRFKRYWLETDCGEDNMYRSDSLGWQYGLKIPGTVYAPTRELIRHYDGYSHVGKLLGTIAPPLYIPAGFFEKNMQVCVGYPNRKDGWQNLYSAAERLYSIDPHGAEARWTEDDIPLFWYPHISELDINPKQDVALLKQARDAAFLAMTRIPLKAHSYEFGTESHPSGWFLNHMLSGQSLK
jgi:hypothetical protein